VRWTRISERMPNEGAKVLLCVGDEIVTGYRGRHWHGGFGTGPENGSCIGHATYWAPYPNTPHKTRSGQ
jgi:hypothetical protein